MIAPKYRESFARHAAPEATDEELRLARRRLADAEREVRWLVELRQHRQDQIEAGEWPARTVDR